MNETKSKKTIERRCCCSWLECESYRMNIQNKASNDDLWRQGILRVQFTNTDPETISIKKYALFQSIKRHLLIPSSHSFIPTVLYIHAHHFPKCLLQWRKNHPTIGIATPLLEVDAKLIEKQDDGYSRFTQFTNSVYHIHNRDLKKCHYTRDVVSVKFKKQYVQSPLTTKDEVISFISSFSRQRIQRINKSNISPVNIPSPIPATRTTFISTDLIPSNNLIHDIQPSLTLSPSVPFSPSTPPRIVDNNLPIADPESPSIIPSVFDLHTSLIEKFKKFNGNFGIFSNRKSVKEIVYLLHDYHKDESIVSLGFNNTFYYPCSGGANYN